MRKAPCVKSPRTSKRGGARPNPTLGQRRISHEVESRSRKLWSRFNECQRISLSTLATIWPLNFDASNASRNDQTGADGDKRQSIEKRGLSVAMAADRPMSAKLSQTNNLIFEEGMPARKWTDEQKARQSVLIRTWKPWATSTGPVTPKGKAISSKNAVNYSLRAVSRELVRTNRALLAYLTGAATMAPSIDQSNMNKLLDEVEKAFKAPRTQPTAKAKAANEPQQPAPVTTDEAMSVWD